MSDFQQRVAVRFDGAATTYDAHSPAQRHAATQLAGLIATAGLPPRPRVLELGCGTGHLTERLCLHLPGARILATDIAPAMVSACRVRLGDGITYATMDASRPASADFYDLICANLAVQWLPDLPDALQRMADLLVPGGLLAVSLLGSATFAEWRAAHARLGLMPGLLPFPTLDQLSLLFPKKGTPALQCERWIDRPASGLDFLRSLRAIGADTPVSGHAPLSAGQFRKVLREMGETPAVNYELIYCLWRKRAPPFWRYP